MDLNLVEASFDGEGLPQFFRRCKICHHEIGPFKSISAAGLTTMCAGCLEKIKQKKETKDLRAAHR